MCNFELPRTLTFLVIRYYIEMSMYDVFIMLYLVVKFSGDGVPGTETECLTDIQTYLL